MQFIVLNFVLVIASRY